MGLPLKRQSQNYCFNWVTSKQYLFDDKATQETITRTVKTLYGYSSKSQKSQFVDDSNLARVWIKCIANLHKLFGCVMWLYKHVANEVPDCSYWGVSISSDSRSTKPFNVRGKKKHKYYNAQSATEIVSQLCNAITSFIS
jgi:hypothetical protein